MGDLSIKQDDYYNAMLWYLKHSNIIRELNTEYIIDAFAGKITKIKVKDILEEILIRTNQTIPFIFYFLQGAKILVDLSMLDEGAKLFDIVKKISEKGHVSRVVRNELKIVFGDP